MEFVGLRIINLNASPRGVMRALQRVKVLGAVPRQIVDVGAGQGKWTKQCLQVFPQAYYFLIDPRKENKAELLGLRQAHPRVRVYMAGLGSQTGRAQFHLHGDQSSFLKSEFGGETHGSKCSVELRTLDSFFVDGTIKAPDLIKADVQGFELEVLKGAQKCLEYAELLLLEVSFRQIYENCPLAQEIIAYVHAKGFRIYDICTYGPRPFDGELAQGDILFARRDSELFAYEGWNAPKEGPIPKKQHVKM